VHLLLAAAAQVLVLDRDREIAEAERRLRPRPPPRAEIDRYLDDLIAEASQRRGAGGLAP